MPFLIQCVSLRAHSPPRTPPVRFLKATNGVNSVEVIHSCTQIQLNQNQFWSTPEFPCMLPQLWMHGALRSACADIFILCIYLHVTSSCFWYDCINKCSESQCYTPTTS